MSPADNPGIFRKNGMSYRLRRNLKRAAAGLVLLVFGIGRMSWEGSMEEEWKRLQLRAGGLDLGVREQLGQMSYLAALGGFRSLVASFLSVKAFNEWENVDWVKLESTYGLMTRLQPRVAGYWEEGAWHLAYNASAFYLLNEEMSPGVRRHLGGRYIRKGEEFLREGIRNNPEEYLLRQRLAEIYRNKFGDHCRAADEFAIAARLEGAPEYCRRFAAYEMADCEGREWEAYAALAGLYGEGVRHRKPTLLAKLGELEEKLSIPEAKRVLPEKGP